MEKKISWKSRDHQKRERSVNWYWTFWSIIILIVFVVSYFYKDYLFSGLIVLIGFLITITNMKKPEVQECEITDTYFLNSTKKEKTLFESIEYYNIDKKNHVILFKEKGKIDIPKTLPFEPTQNMKKIDEYLSKKIEKKEDYVYPFALIVLNYVLGI